MVSNLQQASIVLVVIILAIGAVSPSVAAAESLGFERGTTIAERGDVATIDLYVPVGGTTLITIRGATNDYELQTAIIDRDKNGRATLAVDTHRAGRLPDPTGAISVAGRDLVKYVRRPSEQRTEPLPSGRYNIIATTPSTSVAGVLRLINGSMGTGSVHTASVISPVQAQVTSETPWQHKAAQGDFAVSRFNVSGIGALIRDAPANDMIRARDPTPTTRTVHTIRVTPPRNISLRQVTVDYGAGDGNVPLNIRVNKAQSPTIVGIDTNNDGIIDTRSPALTPTVSVSTISNGGPQFTFDDPIHLDANESLYLRVPMTNPSATGSDHVQLGVNDEIRLAGEITYGTAGSGTLGHGVDLQLRTQNATVINPLAAATLTYNGTENRLRVTQPTAQLPHGNYTHVLRFLSAYPYGNTSSAITQFTVTSPHAAITSINRIQTNADNEQIRLRAITNLAPGRRVRVRLDKNGSPVRIIVTTVNNKQQITERITIPPAGNTSTYAVQISYRDVKISNKVKLG